MFSLLKPALIPAVASVVLLSQAALADPIHNSVELIAQMPSAQDGGYNAHGGYPVPGGRSRSNQARSAMHRSSYTKPIHVPLPTQGQAQSSMPVMEDSAPNQSTQRKTGHAAKVATYGGYGDTTSGASSRTHADAGTRNHNKSKSINF